MLNDLLILDFTRAVAGPYCTMLLGDLGARVIKVEEEESGDETRQWGPPFLDGLSTYYLSMNRNKESIAVNLKSEEGRRLIQAVAAKADVVIENFRPGVAGRLGIGYQQLAAANPRLVYASVSGYGQTGPDRLKAGYDLIIQAISGCMYSNGTQQQGPMKVAFPVADILAGLFVGQAILAALYSRERTGRGRRIDVSLFDGMLCAMSNLAAIALNTGQEPSRVGIAQASIVPYQLFQCADAPIVAGAPNDRLWHKLCEALGHPEWAADPRFATNALRQRHRAACIDLLAGVFQQRTAAEWIAELERHDLPCGPVHTITEALSQAPVVEVEHGKLGKIRLVANPMRFDGFEPRYRVPPDLGSGTELVKKEFLG